MCFTVVPDVAVVSICHLVSSSATAMSSGSFSIGPPCLSSTSPLSSHPLSSQHTIRTSGPVSGKSGSHKREVSLVDYDRVLWNPLRVYAGPGLKKFWDDYERMHTGQEHRDMLNAIFQRSSATASFKQSREMVKILNARLYKYMKEDPVRGEVNAFRDCVRDLEAQVVGKYWMVGTGWELDLDGFVGGINSAIQEVKTRKKREMTLFVLQQWRLLQPHAHRVGYVAKYGMKLFRLVDIQCASESHVRTMQSMVAKARMQCVMNGVRRYIDEDRETKETLAAFLAENRKVAAKLAAAARKAAIIPYRPAMDSDGYWLSI